VSRGPRRLVVKYGEIFYIIIYTWRLMVLQPSVNTPRVGTLVTMEMMRFKAWKIWKKDCIFWAVRSNKICLSELLLYIGYRRR